MLQNSYGKLNIVLSFYFIAATLFLSIYYPSNTHSYYLSFLYSIRCTIVIRNIFKQNAFSYLTILISRKHNLLYYLFTLNNAILFIMETKI